MRSHNYILPLSSPIQTYKEKIGLLGLGQIVGGSNDTIKLKEKITSYNGDVSIK